MKILVHIKNRKIFETIKNKIILHITFIILIINQNIVFSQNNKSTYPFQNPNLSIEERVNDLINRLTLDEKVKQMLYNAPAIERLGIPEYNWWNEALHGVARAGRATVFPQAIGLAASWDEDLIFRVATTIANEARAKHHNAIRNGRRGIYEGLTFWSPNINIFRDPRWGRGMETYGEDPFLTGRLAVQFVKGMQGDNPKYFKTIATPKHFAVHSGPESDRHTFNAEIDERDLRETYLPAFRAAIIDGGAQSIMCAYNRFRGDPCCGSNLLLKKILRDEWKFKGYVVSDCWAIMDFYNTHQVVKSATEAAAMALKAGTDLNCGVTYDSLDTAVKEGLVSEDLVNQSLKRLFYARFKLGMFDPPEEVPYSNIPITILNSKAHKQLALEAARKSIVLLKNQNNLLPLSKKIKSIAVIGPNADDVEVLLGNYNGIPYEPVTPLQGIKSKVGRRTKVLFARGCDVADSLPYFEVIQSRFLMNSDSHGLKGEYFNNNKFQGEPFAVRNDSVIDFNWWENPPMKGMPNDSFSIRWSGVLIPPITGKYSLGVNVFGGFRIFIDDTLLIEYSDRHVVITQWKDIYLSSGTKYKIKVEYWDRRADASVKLVWAPPKQNLKEEALNLAKSADVVVAVMGLSPRLEGEEMSVNVPGFFGGDRVEIGLPRQQEILLKELSKLGKPIVLVLLNGSAVAINWASENIPAIMEAWYPGQAGGDAIADILFGDYNPAGRLPITFYSSLDPIPAFTDYSMKERTYRYFTNEPLYPFGYGLSYSKFKYSNFKVPDKVKNGEKFIVSVEVQNVGKIFGEEVVQFYIKDLDASVPVPLQTLQGFKRISLKPSEKKKVEFTIEPRQLSLIDKDNKRIVEPGIFKISIGGRQPGNYGKADVSTTEVLTKQIEVVGDVLILDE